MYENILLDLDGTLSDNSKGIFKGVIRALEYFNIDYCESDLNSFIGPPLLDSFMIKYNMDNTSALKAVEVYREYYSVDGLFENTLYDGVEKVLSVLKERGKKLYLTTAKPQVFAEKIMIHFGVDHYFEGIYGATLDTSRIHKEDIIKYVIMSNKLEKRVTIMVGDRYHDIEGADVNGIDSVGVTYGFGSRDELVASGADFVIDDIAALPEIL